MNNHPRPRDAAPPLSPIKKRPSSSSKRRSGGGGGGGPSSGTKTKQPSPQSPTRQSSSRTKKAASSSSPNKQRSSKTETAPAASASVRKATTQPPPPLPAATFADLDDHDEVALDMDYNNYYGGPSSNTSNTMNAAAVPTTRVVSTRSRLEGKSSESLTWRILLDTPGGHAAKSLNLVQAMECYDDEDDDDHVDEDYLQRLRDAVPSKPQRHQSRESLGVVGERPTTTTTTTGPSSSSDKMLSPPTRTKQQPSGPLVHPDSSGTTSTYGDETLHNSAELPESKIDDDDLYVSKTWDHAADLSDDASSHNNDEDEDDDDDEDNDYADSLHHRRGDYLPTYPYASRKSLATSVSKKMSVSRSNSGSNSNSTASSIRSKNSKSISPGESLTSNRSIETPKHDHDDEDESIDPLMNFSPRSQQDSSSSSPAAAAGPPPTQLTPPSSLRHQQQQQQQQLPSVPHAASMASENFESFACETAATPMDSDDDSSDDSLELEQAMMEPKAQPPVPPPPAVKQNPTPSQESKNHHKKGSRRGVPRQDSRHSFQNSLSSLPEDHELVEDTDNHNNNTAAKHNKTVPVRSKSDCSDARSRRRDENASKQPAGAPVLRASRRDSSARFAAGPGAAARRASDPNHHHAKIPKPSIRSASTAAAATPLASEFANACFGLGSDTNSEASCTTPSQPAVDVDPPKMLTASMTSMSSESSSSAYSFGIPGRRNYERHNVGNGNNDNTNPYEMPDFTNFHESTPFMQFNFEQGGGGVRVVETMQEELEDDVSIDEFHVQVGASAKTMQQQQVAFDVDKAAAAAVVPEKVVNRRSIRGLGVRRSNSNSAAPKTPSKSNKLSAKNESEIVKRFFAFANSSFGSVASSGDLLYDDDDDEHHG